MSRPAPHAALEFLHVATPGAWLGAVAEHIPELLVDHANCEKKAAGTALSLMYKYVDQAELLHRMSRLAREELRHFEQVIELMQRLDVPYTHIGASRYAQELHHLVARQEPERLVDLLILGAVIEARSCERFVCLVDVLPAEIAELYGQLVQSEARHFQDYLQLARQIAEVDITPRIEIFLQRDAALITSPDHEFRFHSGVPG